MRDFKIFATAFVGEADGPAGSGDDVGGGEESVSLGLRWRAGKTGCNGLCHARQRPKEGRT